VLQGQKIVENGKIKATWCVVPGLGMRGLFPARGDGGFEVLFGKESSATPDYWLG
jgi:hypothetical protein